ncbi:hypothetical protein DUI87_18567 [Hirundo rustica rustica]|uniref:Uncharacterized protein n=1 Tax=Hirundo rustica rustica TaxID=333673 RepID=A0A3M0JX84_HIRRU|nr:hypothetical protein DUI87_18567 [Hirundo rustica rustica]
MDTALIFESQHPQAVVEPPEQAEGWASYRPPGFRLSLVIAQSLSLQRLAPENHRITGNYELEETLKDRVQLPTLHRTSPESHHVPKSIAKHFLNSGRLGAVATSLESLFQCPNLTFWIKNLFLISSLNLL